MADVTESTAPPQPGAVTRILRGKWLILILIIVVILAIIVAGAARPAPSFSIGSLTWHRSCFFNTTSGNYSSWDVSFTIANTGPGASAAVAISIDNATVSYEHVYVATGAMAAVQRTVADSAVPLDSACEAHNVTVAIWGYVF